MKTKLTRVSILGCGWLGLPLGKALMEQGFAVKGSTTHPQKSEILAQAGIQPFLLTLIPHLPKEQVDEIPAFLNTDVLIVNIPPQTHQQGMDFHPLQILHLSEQLKLTDIDKIIYVSATSVYPDENCEVTETEELTKENSPNPALRRAEDVLSGLHRKLTILRCGGLMGYNRMPGKYVAGKQVNTAEVPVNFVHRDDVVQIIYEIIRQDKWNTIYNVVAPQHPVRRDVYLKNAADFGLEKPEFVEGETPAYKVVNGDKLIRELKYAFIFPDPLHFSYEPN